MSTDMESSKLNKKEVYDAYDRQATDIESGRKDSDRRVTGWYPFVAFLLIGTAELYGFNGYLNSSFDVFMNVYSLVVPPTIGVCYFTLNCIITIIAMTFPKYFVKPIVTYFGLLLTLIDAILYPMSSYASSSIAMPLFHLMGCFMGISSAVIGASGFGYANYFDQNYGSVMSAGLGVAGMLSFVLWIVAKLAVFRADTPFDTRAANWVVQGFSIILSMSTLAFSIKFFADRRVKLIVNKFKIEEQEQEKKRLMGEKVEEEESILQVFLAAYPVILTLFWTMFVTLFCFPAVGPFRWGTSSVNTNILLGLYQFGDLVGRFSPNFVPFLMLSTRGIVILGAFRSILIATFVICKEYYYVPQINNTVFHVFQMLFLSISNGVINTSCFIRAPEYVGTSIGKARCSAVALLALMIGLTAGQWAATAYVGP